MRLPLICILAFAAAPLDGVAARPSAGSATYDRGAVIAALERRMLTGEPRHLDHDEGEWLQRAVGDAFRRNDIEIIRLAQRAAVPLVPRVYRPVSPRTDPTGFEIGTAQPLVLPVPVRYRADMFASLDGGAWIPLRGSFERGGNVALVFPRAGDTVGFHHLRLQAHIVYEGAEGMVPPPEVRNLPELVYAIYDPAGRQYDARMFVASPASVNASRFDPSLPDVPFSVWINELVAPHRVSSNSRQEWVPTFCDERVREAATPSHSGALCTIAYFQTSGTIGQVWFRTGRVELAESEVRWLVEAPTFLSVRLVGGRSTEVDSLSSLPALLAAPRESWPIGDVSVAPEDISITPGRGHVRVKATVRNTGNADLRGATIHVSASTSGERGDSRTFVRDIPRYGEVRIEGVLALPQPYGTVLVQAMQLGEHTPHESWMPDPTPEDAAAFRIVNPRRAPRDYARWIREQCGFICRGY